MDNIIYLLLYLERGVPYRDALFIWMIETAETLELAGSPPGWLTNHGVVFSSTVPPPQSPAAPPVGLAPLATPPGEAYTQPVQTGCSWQRQAG